ncbi:MAG: hypothetical protein NTY19_24355 [Planctomycetota bacterium]|nr:hypothetical protein [Planctomycetota bacterium]
MQTARQAEFDIERMLFPGRSLEDAVRNAVAEAVECHLELEPFGPINCHFLETISNFLAREFTACWDCETGPNYASEGVRTLALSLLYLFPGLWKATNKRLSVGKLKTLDLDVLLSERR